MSGLEHRVDAVFRCRRPDQVPDDVLEQVRPGYECETIRYDLEAADAADKAAGIYRVSLDDAVEAAAKQDCDDWANCHVKDVHRTWARKALTAAVTGGAQ